MKTIKYLKNINKIKNNYNHHIQNNILICNLYEVEKFLCTLEKTNILFNIIKDIHDK